MKKFLCLLIAVILVLSLCGCGVYTALTFTEDWTSPDGVHYWLLNNGRIVPRYIDTDGHIMVDK